MGITRRVLAVACAIGASVLVSFAPAGATEGVSASAQQVAVQAGDSLSLDGAFDFIGVSGKWDGAFNCQAIAAPAKAATSTVLTACYIESYDTVIRGTTTGAKAVAVGVGPVKKAAQDPQITLCISGYATFKDGTVIHQSLASASTVPVKETPHACTHG